MRFVKVKFLNTRDDSNAGGYFYRDTQSRALKKWDTVIVPTRYGLSMAYVMSTYKDEELAKKAYENTYGTFGLHDIKEVAEKIKSSAVEEKLKTNKALDLKKQLDSKIKKIDEVEKYRVYAGLSPEVAELLKQLKTWEENLDIIINWILDEISGDRDEPLDLQNVADTIEYMSEEMMAINI